MSFNTIGNNFKLTTFGESHGIAIGGIIDGVPANIELNIEAIHEELKRRKPGQSKIVTQRKEDDKVEFLSGIFEGKTTGAPIGFIIKNDDARAKDYEHLKDVFRPSHADYTYYEKYGHKDHRGGGRASARETANWVVAGALAKQVIASYHKTSFEAYVSSIGDISLEKPYTELDLSQRENNPVRCPDEEVAEKMEEKVKEVRKQGDTTGGVVTCVIKGVPVGLGEPVFDKLHARLGQAMLSINAVKGF
ncbi:MAG: chorismate synthase, partial [Flavobacteriales bacterium]